MAFGKYLLCGSVFFSFILQVHAVEVPLTILHTNDLHSHYKQDEGPVPLGGIARMATLIRRIRNSVENSLLVDGGDRKSTRLNSSHLKLSRMPSSA